MDIIKTLTGLINDVDNNDIDSLKDLYLELIYLRSELQNINYAHCCKSDSELLKASFKKGDTVLLDNSQKVIYIEDFQNNEIMLRHIAGYKFIVNASRVSSL